MKGGGAGRSEYRPPFEAGAPPTEFYVISATLARSLGLVSLGTKKMMGKFALKK